MQPSPESDDFFFMLTSINMRDYQQRCFFIEGGNPNRVPALFASLVDTIFDESEVRIIEHLRDFYLADCREASETGQ